MIFRHEYLQLIYLRENGFDEITYKRKAKRYLPELTPNNCESCGHILPIPGDSSSCLACSQFHEI